MKKQSLGVTLLAGDCVEIMSELDENSIDSCVCDPPYHLTSIVKRMGAPNAAPVGYGSDGRFQRMSGGFMGKQWDGGDVAFRPETWAEVYRVLKPGGYLLAFSGTRTYHRMACAIEDAGFEVRDMVSWVYGSGFPKSHNAGNGWGTALKPALEPICMARKPLSEKTVAANVLKWGTGAINVGGCRVGTEKRFNGSASSNEIYGQFKGAETGGREATGRWPANIIHDGSDEVVMVFPTRFFYHAKANKRDRIGSKHPTVKPINLMQYLCRMVTPKGGTVLDPFAGTGTTGEAAWREGFKAILIEREKEYQRDITRRMKALTSEGLRK